MKRFLLILTVLIVILFPAAEFAFAQTAEAPRLFEQYCSGCHGNPAGPQGAVDDMKLRTLMPEAIYAALGRGRHARAGGPSDDQKRMIAEYLGARKVGVAQVADAKRMTNACTSNPPLGNFSASPSWNGWGVDATNARFQPAAAAGLSASQVPQLKLKWAFGFPMAEEMFGQPAVAFGRVFIGADTGAVYSLDAASGCVYWSFQADGGVRTAVNIAPTGGSGSGQHAIYFGDLRANVYSLDAATGKLLWKVRVEDNPIARITGAPTLHEGRLYVPTASLEERAGGLISTHPCCTFRGSIVAMDARTGRRIWKTYIIPEAPKPTRKTSKGIQLWTPSGGAVWSSPTVDPMRRAIYIGTGDAYTEPAPKTTDAIMALSMDTGKVLWSVQDTENDAWLFNCGSATPPENCPSELGPDWDFGASPILRTLPGGRRILVAGQKSGMVWGHDPDEQGAVVWKAQLVEKLALGMITFGGAADQQSAYFGLRTGGVAAVNLATGEKRWFTPVAPAPGPPGPRGETAAITAIPGVIFSGSWEGILRAFATDDGRLLWEYNTAREFQTVNGVPAKGGSMGAPGPVIVGGTMFVGSGYVFGAGTPGNVLLAFSVQ